MTNRTETLVACVVMIDNEGRSLLGCRPEGKVYAGWWEFPGGKLEAMETVEEAAKREMREELGIDLQNSSPWVTLVHDYPHARVRLHFVRSWQWRGEPRSLEGQSFGFFSPLDWPTPILEASEPIQKWLLMPKHWVKIQSESALENLEAQKERSFDGAILCGDYIKEFDDWKKRLMALGIKEIWVDATASDEQQKRADGVFVDEGQSVGNVIHERFAVKADSSNWESIAQSGALFAWVDPAIRVASSAWLRLLSDNPVPLYLTNVKINDEKLLRPHGANGWIETI